MSKKTRMPPRAKKIPGLNAAGKQDDYAWLRDPEWSLALTDPERIASRIKSYLQEENDYCQTALAPTAGLQKRLFREMKMRLPENDCSPEDRDGDYCYYTRWRAQQQYPLFCRRHKKRADEEVLLDGNAEAQGCDYLAIGDCLHSPNHRLIAYTEDRQGSEFYTLHVRDLRTQRELIEPIPRAQGDFVWFNDSQSLVYLSLDDCHRPDEVRLRRLDGFSKTLYKEQDKSFFVSLGKTRSSRFILIQPHDHTSSEVWLVDADRPETEAWLVHQREKDLEYSVEERDGQLFILCNADGAENYKLARSGIAPGRHNWLDFFVPQQDVLLESVLIAADFTALLQRREGLQEIVILDKEGQSHRLDFDEAAYELNLINTFDYRSPLLRFSYSSMARPEQTIDYHYRQRTRTIVKRQQVPCGHNPERYQLHRLFADSHDGERVPITLIHDRNVALDGRAPLLLYGYGAYGHSLSAGFSIRRLSLLHRGYVYAIAHVRGGMEKGYRWYRQGKMENKRNTFLDFIAVAEHLIRNKVCAPHRLAIHGGSAGGMLIGAALNQRPELFASAIAEVPFVDVLSTMCDPDLPLTPPEWLEWGNPIKDQEARRTIASYSPYDNVSEQAYPHLLVTAGLSDPRVSYWEPAKWVAKLRSRSTSDSLILLKTIMSAGHAGPSGRYDNLWETALNYAFLLRVMDCSASGRQAQEGLLSSADDKRAPVNSPGK